MMYIDCHLLHVAYASRQLTYVSVISIISVYAVRGGHDRRSS